MQIHITARHIELTPALADYVEKRLEKVARHFDVAVRAHVILDVQKQRHMAEIVVHAAGHSDFRAKDVSADLYAAVDLVVEKLHKHMARQKDKRVRGRRGSPSPRTVPFAEDLPLLADPTSDDPQPRVTRVSRFVPHVMTVVEAVEHLEALKHGFTVFMNDDQLSILYKRRDGTYALLEPSL